MSFPFSSIHGRLTAAALEIFILAVPIHAQVTSAVKLLASPDPVVLGQNVTFTVGVNPTAAASPTGTITVTDTVTCPGANGATVSVLGTITLGLASSPTPGVGTLVVSTFPCPGPTH